MRQIHTLAELDLLSRDKRAVVVPGTVWRRPTPAAFMMNLQARIVQNLLMIGMFVYEKEGESHGSTK